MLRVGIVRLGLLILLISCSKNRGSLRRLGQINVVRRMMRVSLEVRLLEGNGGRWFDVLTSLIMLTLDLRRKLLMVHLLVPKKNK